MRRIYTQALYVWAWLFPKPECDLGMDLIEAAGQNIVSRSPEHKLPQVSRNWLISQIRNSQMNDNWEGFIKILQQPYWRRNWIIQELFVGRQQQIICGVRVAKLDLVFGIILGLLDISFSENLAQTSILGRVHLNSWDASQIALLISHGSQTLSNMLRRFASSNATDPRDKVYSLIGIATPYPGVLFEIDYTIGWPQVFSRATRYLIEGERNLDILGSSASGSSELPSWVPNFARQSIRQIGSELNELTPNSVTTYTTDYNAGSSRMPMAYFSIDGTRLTVKVVLVDSLPTVLPRRGSTGSHSAIDELTRRLQFLLNSYKLPTSQRSDMPESLSQELKAYACLQFYQATFLTKHFSSMVEQVWPVQEFVRFGMQCIAGMGHSTNCTEAQLNRLGTALTPNRSFFTCELKKPFSLEEDFRKAHGNISNIDADVIPALRKYRFQVPGYCRNQRNGGQNGDIVSIVLGCSMPLLLRPVSKPGALPLVMRVVSEAYVYGIMAGEAVGKLPECEVTLV